MSYLRTTFGYVAVAVTVLTFLTLTLDLPKKVYELFPYIHTPSGVSVSFLDGETQAFSDVTRQGVFFWEPYFEINNISKQDVTVTGLETLFDPVKVKGHSLHLKQVEHGDLSIDVYDDVDSLNQGKSKVGDRLPYTIKSGTKKYIGFENEYVIERDGSKISRCNTRAECMKVLGESLDENFESDKPHPRCPHSKISTRIQFSDYESLMTVKESTLLLLYGCTLIMPNINDISPLPTSPNMD
jgi:hypothetical protein